MRTWIVCRWVASPLCRASLVFRVRGRVRVLGSGFCVRVRVRVSVTGSVSYLNENFVVYKVLLSAPAIHRQSSQELRSFLASVVPAVKCRESSHTRTVNSTWMAFGFLRRRRLYWESLFWEAVEEQFSRLTTRERRTRLIFGSEIDPSDI